MQARARIPGIPLTSIGNELKALKLKFIRRSCDPTEVLSGVIPQIKCHNSATFATDKVETDSSVFREVGEFALNFSYLVSRVCEQNIIPTSCPSAISEDNALSFVDPTASPDEVIQDVERHRNVPQCEPALPRTNPSVTKFSSRRFKVPHYEHLSKQTCQQIHILLQQYVSAAMLQSDALKLQHINGVVRSSLLLRDYFQYAFPLAHEMVGLDETISMAYELMVSFIKQNKNIRVRRSFGSGLSSPYSSLLVPSNAIINSLDICDKIVGRGIQFGAAGGPVNIRSLLPIKAAAQMEAKLQKCGSMANQLMALLLEMDAENFQFLDASTTLQVLGKAGFKNNNLIEKCLETIYTTQRSDSQSPTALSQILYSCGVMGVSHPLLPKIARPTSEIERPDGRLLRTLSMSAAMLNLDPYSSGLTKNVLETWWKRLACKTNVDLPFCVLFDIGHALKCSGISSAKANYSLSLRIQETLHSERRDRASGITFLDKEALPTLLKCMYVLGDTQTRKGDKHWDTLIKDTVVDVASEAYHQLKAGKIVHYEDVVGLSQSADGTANDVVIPHNQTEETKMQHHRELQDLQYKAHFSHSLMHCQLEVGKLNQRPAPANEKLVLDTPNKEDDNVMSRVSDVINVVCVTSNAEGIQAATELNAQQNLVSHKPTVVKLGEDVVITSKVGPKIDKSAKALIDTQWSLLSRQEVIHSLNRISPEDLDSRGIYLLLQRISDNIDGDLGLQKEVNLAMGPLLIALRIQCDAMSANQCTDNTFSTSQLVEMLSYFELIGKPVLALTDTAPAVASLLRSLVEKSPEFTRAQSEDTLNAIDNFICLFDDIHVVEGGQDISEIIRGRFKNL